MTQRQEVYVCQQCGHVAEILRTGSGTMVCCDRPMRISEENTADASKEKHTPAVARAGGEVTVTVGSVPHPMAEDHYIEWIELVQGESTTRRFLKPGSVPQATFDVAQGPVTTRAYCNLHGIWKAEA
jgi:superoxide reductase